MISKMVEVEDWKPLTLGVQINQQICALRVLIHLTPDG
jgi:hypothetical protein